VSLTPAAVAAKKATRRIPIVMAPTGDPVLAGLIDSYAKPGGNVTGVTTSGAEVAGKSLELIRDVFPETRSVGVLANASDPYSIPFTAELVKGGQRFGWEMAVAMVEPGTDFSQPFADLRQKGIAALVVQGSLQSGRLFELARANRIAIFSSSLQIAGSGGLMTYSASFDEILRLAAQYVTEILHGRPAADLPVSAVTKFDLIINMKTAAALGLTLPPSLLLRADRIIE